MRSDIWILMPAFNEEESIGKVIEEVHRCYKNVIVVNDGSDDDTGEIAGQAGCVVLNHESNLGKGAAIKTGFGWLLERKYSAVITLDADGQHDPAEILRFIECFEKIKSDAVIIGNRSIERESMPLYRAIPNRIGELFISIAAIRHIPDTQSGFRFRSRKVIEKVRCDSDGFEMEAEMLIRASRGGFGIYSIPIRTIYQANYSSHFRPVKDFYRISRIVLRHIL